MTFPSEAIIQCNNLLFLPLLLVYKELGSFGVLYFSVQVDPELARWFENCCCEG